MIQRSAFSKKRSFVIASVGHLFTHTEYLSHESITLRFCHVARIVLSNGGLPTGEQGMTDAFARIVLSNGGFPTGEQGMTDAFLNWRKFSRESPRFDIGFLIQGATTTKLTEEIIKGYDAPFPDDSYKAGARIMPSLVSISTDDPEHEANKKAFEKFGEWEKPFLTAFSDKDPVTRGGDGPMQQYVPGAKGQKHTTIKDAGHFVQEDKGPELANLMIEFIKDNPI